LLALNVDCSYSRPTQKHWNTMPDPLDNIQLKKPPPPIVSTFNWAVIQLANLIGKFSALVMTVSPKDSLREKNMFQIALGFVTHIPRSIPR